MEIGRPGGARAGRPAARGQRWPGRAALGAGARRGCRQPRIDSFRRARGRAESPAGAAACSKLISRSIPMSSLPEDLQWMHDNVRLVRADAERCETGSLASLRRVPHVRTPDKTSCRACVAIAQDFLRAVEYRYSDRAFTAYVEAFQTVTGLNMNELSLLVPALKLVVLEEFVTRGEEVLQAAGGAAEHQRSDRQHARAVGSAVEGIAGAADCLRAGAGAGSGEGLRSHGFSRAASSIAIPCRILPSTPTARSWRLRSWRWSWRRNRRSIRRAIRGWPGESRMWAIT